MTTLSLLPPECVLGIEELDNQHESLLQQIHSLRQCASAQELQTSWSAFLLKLEEHFDFESALMRESKYSETRIHELDHQSLLKQLNEVSLLQFPSQTIREVQSWMTSHLQGADCKLSKYLLHQDIWLE